MGHCRQEACSARVPNKNNALLAAHVLHLFEKSEADTIVCLNEAIETLSELSETHTFTRLDAPSKEPCLASTDALISYSGLYERKNVFVAKVKVVQPVGDIFRCGCNNPADFSVVGYLYLVVFKDHGGGEGFGFILFPGIIHEGGVIVSESGTFLLAGGDSSSRLVLDRDEILHYFRGQVCVVPRGGVGLVDLESLAQSFRVQRAQDRVAAESSVAQILLGRLKGAARDVRQAGALAYYIIGRAFHRGLSGGLSNNVARDGGHANNAQYCDGLESLEVSHDKRRAARLLYAHLGAVEHVVKVLDSRSVLHDGLVGLCIRFCLVVVSRLARL
mmetsp:Transcript_10088/g.17746  ORF Transcript_10088/g.17746 Transcript_10088/m.17746 type:complete len:331 (-) Transcript_10088:21-1013(-)